MRNKNFLFLFFFASVCFGGKLPNNTYSIGDKTPTNDKKLILDQTNDAFIGWDGTNSKIVFDNGDGNIKNIGSGSGGGGGENFNNAFTDNQNANAESGTTSWTTSNGTLTLETADPLEGVNSFSFIATAQNGYVESAGLNFDIQVLRGTSCEARIEYVGGSTDHKLQIVDAGGTVFKEMSLPVHNIFGQESLFFLCPSAADIAADSDLATLKYRIVDTAASGWASITFDKAYAGSLRGLTEATLPDKLSFIVHEDGSIVSTSFDNSNNLITCSLNVSLYECDWTNLDLSAVPSMNGLINDGSGTCINTNIRASSTTTTGFNFTVRKSLDGTALTDCYTNWTLSKQGTDAKQSVQVYKSIPKVSENVNEFSAYVTGAGSLGLTNTDWIDSVSSSTGQYTLTLKAGVFENTPSCVLTPLVGGSNAVTGRFFSISATSITYYTYDNIENYVSSNVYIKCNKQGSDYKLPTVQPIIVGQVTNSYAESASKNVRVESCEANSAGVIAEDMCNNWIDSITLNGGGTYDIVITPSTFLSDNYMCYAEGLHPDSRITSINNHTAAGFSVNLFSYTGGKISTGFNVLCIGERG